MRRTLQVKGKTWKIRRKKNLKHGDDPAEGLCEFSTRTIFLESSIKNDRDLMHVLLHEIMHAANFEMHLNEEGGIPDAIEEVQASGFPDVLLENFTIKLK